jgi:hypothetical protein
MRGAAGQYRLASRHFNHLFTLILNSRRRGSKDRAARIVRYERRLRIGHTLPLRVARE